MSTVVQDAEEKAESHRQLTEQLRSGPYIDYPYQVAFETIALCNATCNFCPYPGLNKAGELMPDTLIEKIVNDLADVPGSVPIRINPCRINEPFLDSRIFDIFALINGRLPNAGLHLISNGSPLTERNIERLARVKRIVRFNISLNEYSPDRYMALMGLDFDRTVRNLDSLHRLKQEKVADFPVWLSRVGDGSARDLGFIEWVRHRYPAFEPDVLPRGNFMGNVQVLISLAPTPEIPCSQWFKLSINLDGKVPFCCLDAAIPVSYGDAATQHLLEIYNQPWRRDLRMRLPSRLQLKECADCTMLV